MTPAAHSTTKMGDFTNDGNSGSTPLSGTFAAQGYPLYIVIENNNNHEKFCSSATFWHSMYWALFQHMQLLCMATHASDELQQMHKTTEDLLGYLRHSPVVTQPSSSCDESAVCRGTRDGGCQISIHEALKVPLPVQSQPCLQGSHDITDEHCDHEAYDIYSAGDSDVSSSSHAVYDDSGDDVAQHAHPTRRFPSLGIWAIWLLLVLFACFGRLGTAPLIAARSKNYTLAPNHNMQGQQNHTSVQSLTDEAQLPGLQRQVVNISGGSIQGLTSFVSAPTLRLTADTAASTSASISGPATDSSLNADAMASTLASTSSTTMASSPTAADAALTLEPVTSPTAASGLPADAAASIAAVFQGPSNASTTTAFTGSSTTASSPSPAPAAFAVASALRAKVAAYRRSLPFPEPAVATFFRNTLISRHWWMMKYGTHEVVQSGALQVLEMSEQMPSDTMPCEQIVIDAVWDVMQDQSLLGISPHEPWTIKHINSMQWDCDQRVRLLLGCALLTANAWNFEVFLEKYRLSFTFIHVQRSFQGGVLPLAGIASSEYAEHP